MTDQQQTDGDGHPQHPPEKIGTARRRRTDISNTSTKSIFTLNKFRRSHTHEVTSGPVQESFSCYAGLTWDVLRGFLEKKWPGRTFTEDKRGDHWIFEVPEQFTQKDKDNIAALRDVNQNQKEGEGPRPSFSDSD